MKKVISLVLALSLLVALVACGSTSTSSQDGTGAPQPSAAETDTVVEPSASSEDTQTPFERFEEALSSTGYEYEAVVMAAELVGAHAGMKYKFDFGTVELYQFEEGSDTLSKAVEDGGITLEGFGVFPCEFNGNLAAVFDVTENEDILLSLFANL